MNFSQLIKSFKYAVKGLQYVFKNEQNFRFQIYTAMLVFVAAGVLHLRKHEIIVVSLLVMFVLILELLNTVIERFVDVMKPRLSLQIEIVKDIMAAIVLCASLFSLVIGFYIFIPYLLEIFHF